MDPAEKLWLRPITQPTENSHGVIVSVEERAAALLDNPPLAPRCVLQITIDMSELSRDHASLAPIQGVTRDAALDAEAEFFRVRVLSGTNSKSDARRT
jgi:hypothetical protein